MTSTRIETASFQLVAQCCNQLGYHMPLQFASTLVSLIVSKASEIRLNSVRHVIKTHQPIGFRRCQFPFLAGTQSIRTFSVVSQSFNANSGIHQITLRPFHSISFPIPYSQHPTIQRYSQELLNSIVNCFTNKRSFRVFFIHKHILATGLQDVAFAELTNLLL